MKISLTKFLVVLTLILIFESTGCSNDNSTSQYHKSAKKFNSIYFEIVECIDLGNTIKSLERLQSEENSKKIDELGNIIKDIKNNIPKDREQLYNTFNERYENLVYLKESYEKLESFNEDDRGKIDTIFISIGLEKDNWKDKNSSIIWD